VDSLDDGVGMFEIEIELELDIILGEDFGDWGKGRWEKKKQNWELTHPPIDDFEST
jgi:hypothetical protein